MGKKRNTYRMLVGEPEEKGPLRRPRYMWEDNEKKWILEKYDGMVSTEFICIRIRTSGELFWSRKWTFGFRKSSENCKWLSECWLLKKGSAPWS
jgi:hypothetical protein